MYNTTKTSLYNIHSYYFLHIDQLQCDKDKCIPEGWKCDGTRDCEDGTDETNVTCVHHTCKKDHFKCDNGRYDIIFIFDVEFCIPVSYTHLTLPTIYSV